MSIFKNIRPVASRAPLVAAGHALETMRNRDNALVRVETDSRQRLVLDEPSRVPSPPLLTSNLGPRRDVDAGVRLAGGPPQANALGNESELLPPGYYASVFGHSHC
jgi:hypothetical protein